MGEAHDGLRGADSVRPSPSHSIATEDL
jgi:hypothetical protein